MLREYQSTTFEDTQMLLNYHSDVDQSKVNHYDADKFLDGIPKFRSFDRMWNWYNRKNRSIRKRTNLGKRLDSKTERWILENGSVHHIIKYADVCETRLPIEFEDVIFNEENIELHGISYLKNRIFHIEGGERKGIPAYEQRFRTNPRLLLNYAKYLKTRLPEDWEPSLIGDARVCCEYAYGFLNGRLPEQLHNYMYMAQLSDEKDRRLMYQDRSRTIEVKEVFDFHMAGSNTYFDFIKFQRENLKEKISHYVKSYEMDENVSIAEFLHELEFGK